MGRDGSYWITAGTHQNCTQRESVDNGNFFMELFHLEEQDVC